MSKTVGALNDEFIRFYEMLGQQIDNCPEELWVKKTCGYFYWQQVLHTLACVELFSLLDEKTPLLTKYDHEIIFLVKDPEIALSKQEMKGIYEETRKIARAFIDSLGDENLHNINENMSKATKKTFTNFNGLIALVRHMVYHIGSLDAALRENGLKGAY